MVRGMGGTDTDGDAVEVPGRIGREAGNAGEGQLGWV